MALCSVETHANPDACLGEKSGDSALVFLWCLAVAPHLIFVLMVNKGNEHQSWNHTFCSHLQHWCGRSGALCISRSPCKAECGSVPAAACFAWTWGQLAGKQAWWQTPQQVVLRISRALCKLLQPEENNKQTKKPTKPGCLLSWCWSRLRSWVPELQRGPETPQVVWEQAGTKDLRDKNHFFCILTLTSKSPSHLEFYFFFFFLVRAEYFFYLYSENKLLLSSFRQWIRSKWFLEEKDLFQTDLLWNPPIHLHTYVGIDMHRCPCTSSISLSVSVSIFIYIITPHVL